jgi:endonuclease/exonuclease/phosphatase family metal-dependent hydrolase
MGGATQFTQAALASQVAAEIAEIEDERSHRNTVFVGDFNMSPFDPGMTLVTGMHGLMTQQLAEKADRRHHSKNYRRFYNPMWGFFGDRTPGPPGTHYWRSSVIENHHWAILDQVLLRSSIASKLHTLNIIANDGTHSLFGNDGAPDKRVLSDHLPIHFALDI